MNNFILLSLLSIALCVLPPRSYDVYMAPAPGDQRPPCPLLNALANHGELPRNGYFAKDGLLQAVKRNTGMCEGLSDIFFQFGYTLPTSLSAEFPIPKSYILNIRALETPQGGEHEGSMSRVDRENGNSTNYNETRFNQTTITPAIAVNATHISLATLFAGHIRAATISNASSDAIFRGNGDVGLLWNAFGAQPIAISDLLSLFRGQLPPSWNNTAPKEFCTRQLVQTLLSFDPAIGSAAFSLPDSTLYAVCKNFSAGATTTICEDAFPDAIIEVIPFNWVNRTYDVGTLGDPFTTLWPIALQYPSDQKDENCALNASTLFALRQRSLLAYYAALQAPSFDAVIAIATPIFHPNSSIHQAAAGDYYGVEDIIEYITLVIGSLNNGYVWFSPSALVPSSVKYFPENSTMFAEQTHNTTFDCYRFPTTTDPYGLCNSPVVPGIAGGMFTFESCGARIVQYISTFDRYTNEAAVRSSNTWDTCWRIMKYCTGPNQQYGGSWEACMAYMQQIPTTSCLNSVLRGNSTVCRGLHAFLTEHRPAIHCPHTGPDSEPCVDDFCDDVVCAGDVPAGDYRDSPVRPASCAQSTPTPTPTPQSGGSAVTSISIVFLALSLISLLI